MSCTRWFNCQHCDIWVGHLHKNQTTPIIKSVVHQQTTTHLIFVGKVGKLGGNMWLWGVDQLVLWEIYTEKTNLVAIYLTHDHFRDMTQSIMTLDLDFITKQPMKNILMMSSTYTTLNNKRVPPLTSYWEA